MNTASFGMSVHGEGAGLAWSLDFWCWHSPRPSCPHPVLKSAVIVSCFCLQWSHSEAPLCFCECSLRGPCRPSAICGVQALPGADLLDVCLHQWRTSTLAPRWPAVCLELLLKTERLPFICVSSVAMTVPHRFEVTMLCTFQLQQQTRLRRFWNYSSDPSSHTHFEMYLSYFSLVQEKTCQSLFWAQCLDLSGLIFLTAYLRSQTALHCVCCFSKCSTRFFPILTLEECCQGRVLPLPTLPLVPVPLADFSPIKSPLLVRFPNHNKAYPPPCPLCCSTSKTHTHFFSIALVYNFVTNVLEIYIMTSLLLLGAIKESINYLWARFKDYPNIHNQKCSFSPLQPYCFTCRAKWLNDAFQEDTVQILFSISQWYVKALMQ